MPTASNLPMPMSGAQGIVSGFDMGNKLMQQIIQRQQYAQDMELKKQQEERLKEQFNRSYGLQSAASARQAQLFPLQLQQLRQKIEAERMANDPEAQMDYFRRLMGAGMGDGQMQAEAPPAALTGGFTVPEQGEPFTTTPTPQAQGSGLPPDLMQRFIGAQMKKRLGFDPYEPQSETPAQKAAREREMFLWKQGQKSQQALSAPTQTFITDTQRSNAAISKMLPELKALREGEVYGIMDFSPSKKNRYEAKALGLVDSLVAAFKWPSTDKSLQMAEKLVLRQRGETEDAYRSRLQGLENDLLRRLQYGQESLSQGTSTPAVSGEVLTYDPETGGFH